MEKSANSCSEIQTSVPVLLMAIPRGIIPANKNMICQFILVYISSKEIDFVSSIAVTPAMEASKILVRPVDARAITPNKMEKEIVFFTVDFSSLYSC